MDKNVHIFPCKDCIVMPICSKVCDRILHDVDTIKEDKVCIDCGGDRCFQYIAGLYYMVCLRCRTAYYFSIYEMSDRLCRSAKRDIDRLLNGKESKGLILTYTTFKHAIIKYDQKDYEI
jgi:hypothetical protein